MGTFPNLEPNDLPPLSDYVVTEHSADRPLDPLIAKELAELFKDWDALS